MALSKPRCVFVFIFSISQFSAFVAHSWFPSAGETLNAIGTHTNLFKYFPYCHFNGSSLWLRETFNISFFVLFYLSVSNHNVFNFLIFLLQLRWLHPFLSCPFHWMSPCSRALCITVSALRDGTCYTVILKPFLPSPLFYFPHCWPSSLTNSMKWNACMVRVEHQCQWTPSCLHMTGFSPCIDSQLYSLLTGSQRGQMGWGKSCV